MNLSLFLAVNRAGVFLSSSQDSPQKTSPPLLHLLHGFPP
jgi:hypothetical protein